MRKLVFTLLSPMEMKILINPVCKAWLKLFVLFCSLISWSGSTTFCQIDMLLLYDPSLFVWSFTYWNEIYNSELFEKNIGILEFRRPFSNCKRHEEWPHITLHCYNANEIELFHMKWLIVDRLTLIRLGILKVVFPWGGRINLTPPSPPSNFKKNLSNINITLYNC